MLVRWGRPTEHRPRPRPGRRRDRSLCRTGCCPVLMRAGSMAPETPDRSRPLCPRHTQLHSACTDRRKTGQSQCVQTPSYLICKFICKVDVCISTIFPKVPLLSLVECDLKTPQCKQTFWIKSIVTSIVIYGVKFQRWCTCWALQWEQPVRNSSHSRPSPPQQPESPGPDRRQDSTSKTSFRRKIKKDL